MKCQFQILPRVNGGIATADSSFLETGSMVNSFLKTKDVIVMLTTTTKGQKMNYDIGRASNRASAKQIAFLGKLLNERVWMGRPQHEAVIRAAVRLGDICGRSASMYIDMHIRAPRKKVSA